MKQEIEVAQQIYELIINFLVTYSFQIAGAIVILIAGFVVGGWVSRIVLRVQERRNVDVTLRQFIASTARLAVIGLFLIIAVSKLGISITPLIAAQCATPTRCGASTTKSSCSDWARPSISRILSGKIMPPDY